ncbi:SsgA family sporulation/cell division regulator [Streptacidiphilus rugosus]|uniref:SsgA family sporulation/cell division regulator n=1 Tax=Streptacidiphilus rugosus TaxID=405783 RepID=UPI0007C83995|nr:SsgA family sporulation/cell division regulator [Streptacidiphilus rugosus]
MAQALSLTLTANVVLSSSWELPIRTVLTYRADDPYAVSLAFEDWDGQEIVWVISRELLSEGVLVASGIGDVRIWPAKRGRVTKLCLSLKSPEADVVLATSRTKVLNWLRETEKLVPTGTESEHLDLDAGLMALMSE